MPKSKKHRDIPLSPCKSGQIDSYGYDATTNTLAVKYKAGGVYHYDGVPADVHAALCKAESAGKFLHAKIKGAYNFKKVD